MRSRIGLRKYRLTTVSMQVRYDRFTSNGSRDGRWSSSDRLGRRSRVPRDKPRPALEGEVTPDPNKRDGEAITEANQEIDMSDAPQDPGQKPCQAQASDLHDRRIAADCG